MKNLICIIVVSLLLASCADTHQLIRSGEDAQKLKLSPSDAIFIAVPKDGSYGSHKYYGSGQNTAQIIYSAFSKHSNSVRVGSSPLDFNEARNVSLSNGEKYFVYPTILHWEDRATEWSAIPDKLEVKIVVADTSSGNPVETVIVKGKSGLATFGGDHPQDLLPEPVEEFVSTLY